MVVTFNNVSKSYGDVRALDGLSFGVSRGEVVALLGTNGAGKTTALELALGLRRPDSGTVRLFGSSPRETATRRRLGVTPQESGFPDALRVREIAEYVAAHYPHPQTIGPTLGAFGLAALAQRRAGSLSPGESRRIAVALAFIGDSELVVLDEPTTGLDVESRGQVWDAVRDTGAGRTVLFTTHYLEEAQLRARRIVVIGHGRLLFDGDPQALRDRASGRRVTYVGAPLVPVPPGSRVARDGDRVTVTTNDADAYVRALVDTNTSFADLEIGRPSLEEAFLSLTGSLR